MRGRRGGRLLGAGSEPVGDLADVRHMGWLSTFARLLRFGV